ncbi:MAG: hypothetical protein AAFN77_07350 [Planctomycetota bacterium]
MLFKSPRKRIQQRASYKLLEERCLLAGNVTVVENVHLYIRGDSADNQFEIVVDGDDLRINGLDGTTINRMDSYLVEATRVTESGVSFAGGLRAHLGPGHDDFHVRDAVFESSSIVFGGTGDDQVNVIDSQFRDSITIQTYDGADVVSTQGSWFEGDFYAITLDGRDSVSSVDTVFNGDSIVSTGEHADVVRSDGNHYMGDVSLILSQNGYDEVELNNPVVGEDQLGVFMRNHNDTIHGDMMQATVNGSIAISGQAGVDETLGISMNAEASSATSVWSIEKSGLVFESALGGFENVTEAATTYVTTFDSDSLEPDVYIEQYATPVVLETTQTIQLIEWTGTYTRDYLIPGLPDLGDSFVVEIFEDMGDGAPNVDTSTKFEVGGANRVDAGEFDQTFYGTTPLYAYHAEIEYTMEAGKQYWVSIYTELEQDEWVEQNHWEWGMGTPATAESTLFNQGFESFENDWRWRDNPYTIHGIEMDLRLRI